MQYNYGQYGKTTDSTVDCRQWYQIRKESKIKGEAGRFCKWKNRKERDADGDSDAGRAASEPFI